MSYKGLVIYTRFPRNKAEVRKAFIEVAKKKKKNANALVLELIEMYLERDGKNLNEDDR